MLAVCTWGMSEGWRRRMSIVWVGFWGGGGGGWGRGVGFGMVVVQGLVLRVEVCCRGRVEVIVPYCQVVVLQGCRSDKLSVLRCQSGGAPGLAKGIDTASPAVSDATRYQNAHSSLLMMGNNSLFCESLIWTSLRIRLVQMIMDWTCPHRQDLGASAEPGFHDSR